MGLSDLFSKTETAPAPVIKETDWGIEARSYLQKLLGGEFPLQGTAGMSQYEQGGLGQLSNILGGGAFQDPFSSRYYQGIRDSSYADEDRAASKMRRGAQASGAGRSGAAGRAEGELRTGFSNQRNTILGGLYETERNRDNPYTRLQAAMQYGGLPRQIEQQGMDAQYNQAMQPYSTGAGIADQLLNYNPWYQPQQYEQSTMLGSLMPAISGIGGGMLGNVLGGMGGGSATAMTGAPPSTAAQGMDSGAMDAILAMFNNR